MNNEKRVVNPNVDIYENENNFTLFVDIPGATEEQVDIDVNGDVLTISAETSLTIPETYRAQYVERNAVNFSRSFNLKNSVNTEKITAEYKDGVLAVVLPKKEEVKPKKIKINTSGNLIS